MCIQYIYIIICCYLILCIIFNIRRKQYSILWIKDFEIKFHEQFLVPMRLHRFLCFYITFINIYQNSRLHNKQIIKMLRIRGLNDDFKRCKNLFDYFFKFHIPKLIQNLIIIWLTYCNSIYFLILISWEHLKKFPTYAWY